MTKDGFGQQGKIEVSDFYFEKNTLSYIRTCTPNVDIYMDINVNANLSLETCLLELKPSL